MYTGKKLGFGCMRLPRKADGTFDAEATKELIDLYMDAGFTYFDTAYVYQNSEEVVGEALVKRYPRDSFRLATKCSPWHGIQDICKSIDEVDKQFQASLERTGAGYFDNYLLHNLGESRTRICNELGVWDWAQEKKEAGLVKNVGFSFHSSAEELEEILKAHPELDFVQLQINYADWDSLSIQSRKCYEVARKYDKPIIVMEPVKGGLLASPPKAVEEILKEADPDASCASWAIRFAAGLEGVMVVLSGMSSAEQVKENTAFMHDFQPLTREEQGVIVRAREEINKVPLIPCTSCFYCVNECPNNINIAGCFTAMNALRLYHNMETAAQLEMLHTVGTGRQRADACVECGKCEKVCPQHISIRKELEEVRKTFIRG
ncbi:MAG: aldo/keto reductase [Lachnospiraceae bacterium]|nr:aldo/keto reductase [Lachnospiraceae bacterium]